MARPDKHALQTRGITLLAPQHSAVRRLRREHGSPSLHGTKVWESSYVVMNHLLRQRPPRGARFMDLGCGWGPLSIFAAKRLGQQVTSVDADAGVFPFLNLHAELNGVSVTPLQRRFERLRVADMQGIHTLVGTDICFWESLTPVLLNLVRRARKAGVAKIIIADPGRPPFYELVERCQAEFPVRITHGRTQDPLPAWAQLMVIED
ncbi:class I SAM-dependent methyltransferase [Isoalcanivorax beigongshangi]|uniref:Methyltransferase n=1 Tax=Isoalcanivorax beigongshangi TaxID=3238810 RepID=A0ABV4AK24_9GAMM